MRGVGCIMHTQDDALEEYYLKKALHVDGSPCDFPSALWAQSLVHAHSGTFLEYDQVQMRTIIKLFNIHNFLCT